MSKIGWQLIAGGIVILLLFGGGFLAGYKTYPHIKPCPQIIHDTIIVHDTTTYTVHDSIPYAVKDTVFYPDTIEIPTVVDTLAILRDYYAVYDYNWSKQDTNLRFDLTTRVTRNRPVNYDFKYNILRPQTVIINNVDNSITYNKYLYAGLSIPAYPLKRDSIYNINYIGLEAIATGPKGYVGAMWQPYINMFTVKLGVKIFKIKQKK